MADISFVVLVSFLMPSKEKGELAIGFEMGGVACF